MKAITPDSFYDLINLSDVQISPDGNTAAFVRQTVDAAGNTYKNNIWVKDLQGDSNRPAEPLTTGSKDSTPRFSPDGKRLAFASSRAEKGQVYMLNLRGGEAHSIASHKNGAGAFEWSPDSKRIAYMASLRADEREHEDTEAAKPAEPKHENGTSSKREDPFLTKQEKEKREHEERMRFDPRLIKRMPYRTGTNFMEDKWAHIYVTDVPDDFSDEAPREIKPMRVTEGDDGFSLPTWLADSSALISTYSREVENPRWYMYTDVVRIALDKNEAGKPTRTLTRLTKAGYSCYNPQVSPDGQWIAFEHSLEDRPGHRIQSIALLPATAKDAEQEPIDLTASLDHNADTVKWHPDSQSIYFTLLKDGHVNLWRVSVADKKIEQLTALTQEITSFDVDANGRVVFIAATPQDPCALYVREVDGMVHTLYKPNRKFLEEHEVGDIEHFQYPSDEFTIDGWVIRPPNFESGKKYPLVVEIHGGPHVQWTGSFPSMFHEWQALAHKGYMVFFCNPRGADGYGEHFMAANWKDWGPGPTRDVLRGVDEVIARGDVDPERLAITGGSYGGYLSAWIIGHDQRFKAAVSQRGVYNLISMRGTTDIPFFNDFESGSTPWENINSLWEQSPLAHVPNMHTPLLIEHSEQDYRVPMEQAEQLFQALVLLKRNVQLLRWPREGHELSRSGEPRHRQQRIERMIEWFDKYTGQTK